MGDRMGSTLFGFLDHHLGRKFFAVNILRSGLRDLPILAKLALEIASRGGEGKRSCSGKDMKKRFLFNRIDMNRARISIDQAVIFSVVIFSHPADASLPLGHAATVRTQLAPDFSSVKWSEIRR
jgi:hypothetical protein